MNLKMILKSFDLQCDFYFQITTSKMILILNHLYFDDLILFLKSSTYDVFAHLWLLHFAPSQQVYFMRIWSFQREVFQPWIVSFQNHVMQWEIHCKQITWRQEQCTTLVITNSNNIMRNSQKKYCYFPLADCYT